MKYNNSFESLFCNDPKLLIYTRETFIGSYNPITPSVSTSGRILTVSFVFIVFSFVFSKDILVKNYLN